MNNGISQYFLVQVGDLKGSSEIGVEVMAQVPCAAVAELQGDVPLGCGSNHNRGGATRSFGVMEVKKYPKWTDSSHQGECVRIEWAGPDGREWDKCQKCVPRYSWASTGTWNHLDRHGIL